MPFEPVNEFIFDDSLSESATYRNPDGELTQISVIFNREYAEVDVNEGSMATYEPKAWARVADVSDAVDDSGATLTVRGVVYNIVTMADENGVAVITLSRD